MKEVRSKSFLSLAVILLAFSFASNAFAATSGSGLSHSFAYNLAVFITHPIVIPVLLTIGCVGLVMELFTPRLGVPGVIGISAFLLFFYGHLTAGIAPISSIILFAVGIVLILLELVLPGGIIGMIGFGAFLTSFYLATENFVHISYSLLIAFVVSILTCLVMIKVFDKKMKFFKKLILTDSTNTESGYVSNRNRTELIGITGTALTDLRPSGTMLIEDERIDVVTEGSFITKGTPIKIVKVEGVRVVVRENTNIDNEEN